MADEERPRFNLRLTPELDALINRSSKKTGRSKNAVIVDALEWRFQESHPGQDLVDAMRPLLDRLGEDQRAALVEIVATMASGAGKNR